MTKLCDDSQRGINLVMEMDQAIYSSNMMSIGNGEGEERHSLLIDLEEVLLKLGASPQHCQGLFYILPVYSDGKVFLR